ncbi:MAG TPA: penicillin-binding protein 2 [Patescibacteria group bacterium]|nr:penicillin-binding protein 2 [Patescibacteria group bacterium]
MSVLEQPLSHQRRPARFVAFGIAVVLILSGMTVRLASMQLVGSTQPGGGAPAAVGGETRRTVLEAVESTRGIIYDRAGRPLVANVPTFTVRVRPADLPLSRRPGVVDRLAGLLDTTPAAINMSLDAGSVSRFDAVAIAYDIPEATARLIAEDGLTLPGVEVTVEPRRDYLTGALMTQVIGYTGAISPERFAELATKGYLGDDRIGKAGLELTYEAELRGTYGTERVETDGAGRMIRVVGIETPPVAGSSLVLTIDSREQKLAERALRWGLDAAGLERGAMVVLNPQTGEVLAMVSLPTYDANQFSRGITDAEFQTLLDNPHKPLINHAIGAIQPPGSTYKLVTGLGGLADELITRTSTIMTKPHVQIGEARFWEWNRRGWGPLDIFDAFGRSANTYFFELARRLGIERLAHWAEQLGFGSPTGIDLPFEAAGLVPTNQWKMDRFGLPIYPGEVLHAGIGQGYVLSTVLQVANAFAAVANGGKVYQPQVVREIRGPDGTIVRPFEPKLIRTVEAPAAVFATMREAARRVVTLRHTYNLVDLPIVVAGKTGTAEFGVRGKDGVLPFSHWFAGFVPKDAWMEDNPTGSVTKPDAQLAFAVFTYDSRTVGNVATEVAKYYLQLHFGIEQDFRLPELLKRTDSYRGRT